MKNTLENEFHEDSQAGFYSPNKGAKDARIVARASKQVQELIRSAAELSGATVSQFIVEAASARAEAVVQRAHTVRLSQLGAQRVFEALDSAPEPNSRLKMAVERYKERAQEYAVSNKKTYKKT